MLRKALNKTKRILQSLRRAEKKDGETDISTDTDEDHEDGKMYQAMSSDDELFLLGEGEEDCVLASTDLFGAGVKANVEVFVSQTWPALYPMLQKWLAVPGKNGVLPRIAALEVACQLSEHLMEKVVPIWPVFMESVLAAVVADHTKERSAAVCTLGHAAQVTEFGPQYGSAAFAALGEALQKFKSSKKDDDEVRHAFDNAVAAYVQLLLSHPSQCPDVEGCWEAAFGHLPLKIDYPESRTLNRKLFAEALKPGGGNLKSMPVVARVLGYLCEALRMPY